MRRRNNPRGSRRRQERLDSSPTDSRQLKQLAVINSYNENTPWTRNFINMIISEMSLHNDFGPVKVAHLNNGVIINESEYEALQDRFLDFFADRKPDYLVMIGNFAFMLRDKIKAEFGDIPMLIISQNDKYGPLDYYFTSMTNDDELTPPKMEPSKTCRKTIISLRW